MNTIEIKDGLILNENFTWYVKKVNYDWENNQVFVECIFQEGAFKHGRTFEYDAKDGMLEKDILDLLKTEKWYK